MRKTIAACAITALAVGGTTATAASLTTSKDIADGTIQNRDIQQGAISYNRLTPGLRALIAEAGQPGHNGVNGTDGARGAKGDQGATGARGAKGDQGDQGEKGDKGERGSNATVSSGNWGVIARNTVGSPDIYMRSGPAPAPVGNGSLGFSVGAMAGAVEKAAYGNEQDFAGDKVDDLTAVGFRVFTTGENIAAGGATPNMPNITFEIDPNLDPATSTSNYSSLVFVPAANSAANQWSTYIDATTTGHWGLTGAAGAAGPCSLNTGSCTFTQVKAYLNDADSNPATIMTAALSKGRDFAWQGAIDGLRINNEVFDFEETGVTVRTP